MTTTTYTVCSLCHCHVEDDNYCHFCGAEVETMKARLNECTDCESSGRVYYGGDSDGDCPTCNGTAYNLHSIETGRRLS